MPTRAEVSRLFADSRRSGLILTTVFVCFDDASEVMQVQVGIADRGDSGQNRLDAIRAARRLAGRFANEDGDVGERR